MSKYNPPEENFFSPVDRGLVKESNKQGESKKKYSTRSHQIVYLKMSSCLCCLCPSLIPDWFPLLFCPCLTPSTVHVERLAIIAFLGVVTFICRKDQAYNICVAILISMKFAQEKIISGLFLSCLKVETETEMETPFVEQWTHLSETLIFKVVRTETLEAQQF